MPTEEILVAFEPSRETVPPATHFKTTLLHSSQRALRTRGHFPRYEQLVPKEARCELLETFTTAWLPIEFALIHYAACEALALPLDEVLATGRLVSAFTQGSIASILVRLAEGSGATPWTILAQSQRLWSRVFAGSAVGIVKMGPKEARCEIVNNPCAKIPYFRHGCCGILQSMTSLVSTKAYVRDVPRLCTATMLAFRIAWV